jgi:thioredoxin 1
MATQEITESNFEGIVASNDMVVLDAWAEWCGPCRSFAPIYEQASERHPDVIWGKIDTEAQQGLAGAFGIRSIPTLIVFRQGVMVFQQAGMVPGGALDELIEKIRSLDMDEVRREIEAHEAAHARGECNHDH